MCTLLFLHSGPVVYWICMWFEYILLSQQTMYFGAILSVNGISPPWWHFPKSKMPEFDTFQSAKNNVNKLIKVPTLCWLTAAIPTNRTTQVVSFKLRKIRRWSIVQLKWRNVSSFYLRLPRIDYSTINGRTQKCHIAAINICMNGKRFGLRVLAFSPLYHRSFATIAPPPHPSANQIGNEKSESDRI